MTAVLAPKAPRGGHQYPHSLAQSTGSVRVEREGAIAWLVIDRPERRNAISKDMWRQIPVAVEQLDADATVKVLIVCGAGGHFSAGADISEVTAILDRGAEGEQDGGDLTAAEEALAAFRGPTIAAVEGYCVGGGWELAGACDLRIAASDAVFGVTPARLGIVYPLSGLKRLVRLVGPATAKLLLLTGDLIPADEAHRLGLVAQLVPSGRVHVEARDLAERIASRSQFSAHAHKDLIDAIARAADDLAERSASWHREMQQGPDAGIGVRAFLAKERPDFAWVRPTRSIDPQG